MFTHKTPDDSIHRAYKDTTILVLFPNPTNKKKLQLLSELQLYIYDCITNATKDT